MSKSRTVAPMFLFYNLEDGTAHWLLPSLGQRWMNANPLVERIYEEAVDYKWYAEMAGKKPKIYIMSS